MTHNCLSSTHHGRSGAARLVRLAAVTCLALAAGSAAVWAQTTGDLAAGHRCIHDKIQQRVLQSVAQEHRDLGTLSAVGLPIVAAEPALTAQHGGVDYALADSTSPLVERSKEWGQLRINVSYEDLNDSTSFCKTAGQLVNNHLGANVTCGDDDILTDAKRDILINSLIPQALKLHTDRLRVRQVKGNWKVPMLPGQICSSFKVPRTHRTTGLSNTDFMLYVASVPTQEGVRAWAVTCEVFSDDHPAVGVINIPVDRIVSRYDQRTTRIVAHEIAHALGFSAVFFNSTRIVQHVSGVRGKAFPVPVINGTTTANKTREHYGCDTLTYMELEDSGSPRSASSHLKMRNAKDELMVASSGAGYYSALTMAIFEDMGFYKADFSKAEVMPWGRNASCAFLKEKCMENKITLWPQMFCNRRIPEYSCTSDRLDIGPCGIGTYAESPESYWDYFNKYPLAGYSRYMDYCPTIIPYDEGACNQDPETAPESFQSFNVFSEAARCFDGAFAPRGIAPWPGFYNGMCANVQCDTSTQTYSVQVKGSTTYVNCTPGQNITLHEDSSDFAVGSYITCPPYAEVCQGNVRAAMDFEGKHRTPVQIV